MKGHRAAKGRSEPKADGGCGGSSSLAASVLKWGRGSGASGGGRRAAATPNMHSLATAPVSDWAARPRPRTSRALRFGLLLGPCVEPGVQLLLPSTPEAPAPLLAATWPWWSPPSLSSPAGSRGLLRGVSRSSQASGPGPAPGAPVSRPGQAIHCADRQFGVPVACWASVGLRRIL